MDRCVLLTSTPEWVVSPRRAITRAKRTGTSLGAAHLSMINPLNHMEGVYNTAQILLAPFPKSLILSTMHLRFVLSLARVADE